MDNPEKLTTLGAQDEDKQNKKHNTICVGQHHTQDTIRKQANQNTQHNMCWTPLCASKHK